MYGVYYGYALEKIKQSIIMNVEMKLINPNLKINPNKIEKNMKQTKSIVMVTKL